MNTLFDQKKFKKNKKYNNPKSDSVKILSEIMQKVYQNLYYNETIRETEAYYSDRYGWILRKKIY